METKIHQTASGKTAEIISDQILVNTPEEFLQILVDVYYQDIDNLIMQATQFTPIFFDLKSGLAGEVLRKVSNYRMRLAIVGDFAKYPGQSIKDFIYESNKGGRVRFVGTVELELGRID